MKKIMCVFVSMIALTVSGCASMNTLSKEDRAAIRTLEVVVMENPNNLFIYAPGEDLKAAAYVLLLGPSAALYGSPNKSGAELLSTYLQNNNIVIKDIVSTEVSKKLAELGFKQVASGADAVLKVEIIAYGFNQARPLSSELKGAVYLAANLVGPDGTLVNRRVNFCGVFTDFKSHTTQEVFADPSIARDQFTRCSTIAFADIAKGYGETKE